MATVDTLLDNTYDDPAERSPLVLGGVDYAGVTDEVCAVWDAEKPPKVWYLLLGVAAALLIMLVACINHLLLKGVGVWGNNNPA